MYVCNRRDLHPHRHLHAKSCAWAWMCSCAHVHTCICTHHWTFTPTHSMRTHVRSSRWCTRPCFVTACLVQVDKVAPPLQPSAAKPVDPAAGAEPFTLAQDFPRCGRNVWHAACSTECWSCGLRAWPAAARARAAVCADAQPAAAYPWAEVCAGAQPAAARASYESVLRGLVPPVALALCHAVPMGPACVRMLAASSHLLPAACVLSEPASSWPHSFVPHPLVPHTFVLLPSSRGRQELQGWLLPAPLVCCPALGSRSASCAGGPHERLPHPHPHLRPPCRAELMRAVAT